MSTVEDMRRELVPLFCRDLDRVERGEDVTRYIDPYPNMLLSAYRNGISRKQIMISFTKWIHGFNVSDPVKDFDYLVGETEKAREALNTGTTSHFLEELADVVICCYGISQMYGRDFDAVIKQKMDYNIRRSYSQLDEG